MKAEVVTPVSPTFVAGDTVRVRLAFPPGHIRTPWYVRGKVGRVDRYYGAFANPEERAFMRSGLPAQPLYRVIFRQAEMWKDYRGPQDDVVAVDIYQHWLTRIETQDNA
jgi:nitrile hydratase